ncbi:SUMF1/EgtB/PvdO family nonheme iron enzyme [Dysgonomonas sp. ZJ279]|uniref:type IX secretion system lipoprotein PorK/GldK n=1 Tax=Dysgonomonas sp. ZJ279 TaxID=2709796 RepID=UPI0013ECAF3B|nr:SUMF1/EgtB/PvdO family nonheme iron enzyme [Dysgonomonas sp. ZJ279]
MNKKTLLASLLLLISMPIFVHAQNEKKETLSSPSKNEYLIKDPLWTLSIGAGAQMYIGEDDNKVATKKRLTFSPTITLSRRLNNLFGLRLAVTGGSLHGYNDGDSGFYTKWTGGDNYNPSRITIDPQWAHMGWIEGRDYALLQGANDAYGYTSLHRDYYFYQQSMQYVALYGDLTIDLFNLFEGYRPNRRVRVVPFLGLGIAQKFSNNRGMEANTFFATTVGLNASYRFYKNFSAFVEMRGVLVPDSFDGQVADLHKLPSDGILSLNGGISYSWGSSRYIDPALETRLNMPYNIARAKDNMVLVPGGNIELGSGVDLIWGDSVPRKTVSVSPFWMDETEVTNRQYREFVYWVRDSIIRERLADPAYGGDPTYKVLTRPNGIGSEAVGQRLNWQKKIPWSNPTDREAMAITSVVKGHPTALGLAGLNEDALNYTYDWFDTKSYYAAQIELRKNNAESIAISKDTAYVNSRGDIIRETLSRTSHGDPIDFTNTYIVNIYPDVYSWMTDFANAKNEQYMKNYFIVPAFDDFPVAGVSWEQADAFCKWRTDIFNAANPKTAGFETYRLPTEAEWEFAARNGRSELKYPWFSDDTHTRDGLAYSNNRGSNDLKDLMTPVASFLPNRFGLYDMSGNVSEWTTTTYSESVDLMSDEINPDYSYRAVNSDPDILKRKIVKGGSWKDTDSFVRADIRSVEYQNKGRSYIGFRCVRSWGLNKKGQMILK